MGMSTTTGVTGGGAERLRDARRYQGGDACGENRGTARHRRDSKSHEQHGPAPEAVGKRTEHELRHGEPNEIKRNRELHAGGLGGEHHRHSGNCRYQNIEGKRTHPRHGNEQRQ